MRQTTKRMTTDPTGGPCDTQGPAPRRSSPRLATLLLSVCLLALPMASEAQSVEQLVIDRLAAEGYRDIRISRTWLGRVRFVARGPAGEREIVINPSTGAVLRDFLDPEDDRDDAREDGNIRAGFDREEEEDDEQDDDEEEDDDEDDEDDGPDDDDEGDEDDDSDDDDGDDDGGDDGGDEEDD